MTSESTKTKPKRSSKLPTVEAVREDLATKIRVKGAAGLTPFTAKTAEPKRELLANALSLLEAAGQIWVDRTKTIPKAYSIEFGPSVPRAAEKISMLAAELHPALLSDAAITKKLSKFEKSMRADIITHLLTTRALVAFRNGKSTLYAHGETLRRLLATPDAALGGGLTAHASETIRGAYAVVFSATGFPDVEIASLQEQSGVPMDALKAWLRSEHQEGRAHFSIGDWSLASEAVRAGAIAMHDVRYLQVRLEEDR